MKAAADPDSSILRAVLSRRARINPVNFNEVPNRQYRPQEELQDTFGPNSTILLEAGADPNGIDVASLESYQALFLRFRPTIPDFVDIDGDVADRNTLLTCMALDQMSPITEEELDFRSRCVSPFWMLSDATKVDYFPSGVEMHALVLAAKLRSTEIVDMLLDAGSDVSEWMLEQGEQTTTNAASSLAISNPLAAALETSNMPMISHLLSQGFNPNYIPTSTPSMALTPVMMSLLKTEGLDRSQWIDSYSSSFNQAAYSTLASPLLTTLSQKSSTLSIHAIQLAVAHGSLLLLQHFISATSLPPAYISPTALGHTLLHIACLPPSTAHINFRSHAVFRSIHDTRNIEFAQTKTSIEKPPLLHHPRHNPNYIAKATLSDEAMGSYFPAQRELIEFLINIDPQIFKIQDAYGNTPLHYLACHRKVNTAALYLFLVLDGGEEAWKHIRNKWGYSASDLAPNTEFEDDIWDEENLRRWCLETEKEVRAKRRELDEWWDERLAVEWRRQQELQNGDEDYSNYHHGPMSAGTGARGGGGGRSRGGRCGECGRRMPSQVQNFPYHPRPAI
ncbi:hypothetical protein DL98DRAFT_534637 [Cadophora sp. DSE1049]|nr:hypothetical protein DL98DRAFT_534637 [Cadophora sp. DSE1049]